MVKLSIPYGIHDRAPLPGLNLGCPESLTETDCGCVPVIAKSIYELVWALDGGPSMRDDANCCRSS